MRGWRRSLHKVVKCIEARQGAAIRAELSILDSARRGFLVSRVSCHEGFRPERLRDTSRQWIDIVRTGYIDSFHFVGTGGGSPPGVPVSLPLVLITLALLGGCAPERASRTVEDSLTSGRITVTCAPEAKALLRRELEGFQTLYPQASTDLREAPSRDAIRALFANQSDLAVITRELDSDERAAAVRGRLELEGFPFARDAVVAIVNPANPIENL